MCRHTHTHSVTKLLAWINCLWLTLFTGINKGISTFHRYFHKIFFILHLIIKIICEKSTRDCRSIVLACICLFFVLFWKNKKFQVLFLDYGSEFEAIFWIRFGFAGCIAFTFILFNWWKWSKATEIWSASVSSTIFGCYVNFIERRLGSAHQKGKFE